MGKKASAPVTHIRPQSGDSAPLGVINTAATRGGNEIRFRGEGELVRKDQSPKINVKIQITRRRQTRANEVKDPSPSIGEPCTRLDF